MTSFTAARVITLSLLLALPASVALSQPIASDILEIRGMALEIVNADVQANLDTPSFVQTKFGGQINDEVAELPAGLVAKGELTGPGLAVPITLQTLPGRAFQLPGLSPEGTYYLQNIRLERDGQFVQSAFPSLAVIRVSNVFKTEVKVRQLTPDELRSRGILVDSSNVDVYEYTFAVVIDGETVEIPFPVIVDPRTHEMRPVTTERGYSLPPNNGSTPPRWAPPATIVFELPPVPPNDGELPLPPPEPKDDEPVRPRPSIPAAIVIPSDFAVLHQFFAVALMVQNGGEGEVRLDSITANIRPPSPLRVAGSTPPVALGQPITIIDERTGATFLVAKAQGNAEWTLEALKAGTHTFDIDVRATVLSPGQPDIPLRAIPKATIIVHDPSFNVTFSHPDTVRKDEPYSTFAFVTNMSASEQTVTVSSGVQSCQQSPSANVCLLDGSAATHELRRILPGETRTIEYRLRPSATGSVVATAAASDGVGFSAGVQLTMGVSEGGIPLSPATLVMPYYARFLDEELIRGNMRLFGLGFSLATAPVNQRTAEFPRVIRSDVFRRAVDIARAGQRVFITDGRGTEAALANLALDLLGNGGGNDLQEWDQLRREQTAGRVAWESLARALESAVDPTDRTMRHFFDGFVEATSHRAPYFAALVHGQPGAAERPYAITVYPENSLGARQGVVDVPNEAAGGWRRSAAWGELSTLAMREANPPSGQTPAVLETGELALIGRAAPNYHVEIIAAKAGPFTLDIVWPGASGVEKYRSTIALTAVSDGEKFVFEVATGNASIADGNVFGTGSVVPLAPLTLEGARQDLHLDDFGNKVSLLFNRPVSVARDSSGKPLDPATAFEGRVVYDGTDAAAFHYEGPRPVFGAALQEDGRVVNLTFDHILSSNAAYVIRRATPSSGSGFPLVDALLGEDVAFADVAPIVDNDRAAALLTGLVLGSTGEPLADAQVVLKHGPDIQFATPQVDKTDASGRYFFEYVPRDLANDYPGTYELRGVATINGASKETKLFGAVRLPRELHHVNLSFLGRGSAEGYVRYHDGTVVPGAHVVVGSTMFGGVRKTDADATGHFSVADLPVGPLTFSAQDAEGNVAYAANELKSGGQTLTQDLSIYRQPFPGVGIVRGVVLRSDTDAPVAGAQVGVYSQGYPVQGGTTDSLGRFELTGVPAGLVTVLAADWSVSREAASEERDLAADSVQELVLRLAVPGATTRLVRIHGQVVREDAVDPTKSEPVANALVKIEGTLTVTADENGNYVYESMPSTVSGRKISAWDPVTSRTGSAQLDLSGTATDYHVPILIKAGNYGTGTVRVLLLDAGGRPVTAPYFVLEPDYPSSRFTPRGNGVYELYNVPAGRAVPFAAVPVASGPSDEREPDTRPFGDQYASGSALVAFAGHVASATLKLPGQGSVRVGYAPPSEPNQPLATGPVTISYRVWSPEREEFTFRFRDLNTTDSGTGYATYAKVPALKSVGVEAYHPILGYASEQTRLSFDGDVRTVTLEAAKLSTIHGFVYAHDGVTPVAGANVRLWDGRVNRGTYVTNPDGSFEFAAVAAGLGFDVIADVQQAGIHRTGIASGRTPTTGGPVDGIAVVLQKQGSVDVRVKASDGSPAPFARVWMRELSYPYRSFGTSQSPLVADAGGQLSLGGVSVGDVRVSAYDHDNPDLAGDGRGRIVDEGDIAVIEITVGDEGTGTIEAVVVDPNTAQWDSVPNAEVALYKGAALFDFATTDASGGVVFHDVPAGEAYSLGAYSKLLARSGSIEPFTLMRDESHFERIILEFSGTVSGTLRDDEQPVGEPREIPGAHVSLYASAYRARATTGADALRGKFELLGVREGSFKLQASDPFSWRIATGQGSISKVSPEAVVDLTLEPTSTIRVSVWQPNDDGSRSSTLVSAVAIEASQLNGAMRRSTQVNGGLIPGWLREGLGVPVDGVPRNKSIYIVVKEFGGQYRTAGDSITLLEGEAHRDVDITLPAFGTVRVFVRQAEAPASNAEVRVFGKTLYTDSTGAVVFEGIPLGRRFTVQAQSFDDRLTAHASGTLTSQTVPLDFVLDLGSYAAITGVVTAEAGGPSVGTRVVANVGGSIVDQLTDANGRYYFGGIPATGSGMNLCVGFFGPDGATPGAPQKCFWIDASHAEQTLEHNVTLDATRPYLDTVDPVDGAQGVSPDAVISLAFSEEIQFNPGLFELYEIDTTELAVPFAAQHTIVGGASVVRLTPTRNLASQKLHRIVVRTAVSDLSGLTLPADRGATFITTDYANPQIVSTTPDYRLPIPSTALYKIKFNEAITSGAGSFGVKFVKQGTLTPDLGAGAGVAIEDDGLTLSLLLAGDVQLEAGAMYDMTLAGVVDSNGNPLLDATLHFLINDTEPPTLVLQLRTADRAPVADGDGLIERLGYNVAALCTNPDGSAAADIARVEFVRKDITAGVNDLSAPFEYIFMAPQLGTSEAGTVTLEATAYDTSGNPSNVVLVSWPVTRDLAPRDVVVTPTPASTVYAGGKLDIEVTYEDESPATVTARLVVTGTRSNDQAWSVSLSRSQAVSFEPRRVLFRVNVPPDLKPATDVVMAATITDVASQAGSGEARAVVAVDPNPPEIVSLGVEPQQIEYVRGDKFRIRVRARDLDSGVSEVALTIDGKSIALTQPVSVDSTTKTWEFLSAEITVPAKNADTVVTINATAKDYQGNSSAVSSTDVSYEGVYDTNPPKGAWVCPIEGAVLPANKGPLPTTLRIWAQDANDLTVTFSVPGLEAPLTAVREGATNYYSATASLVPPADTTADYVIVGHVSDGDGGFVVDFPVSIRFVDVDIDLKDVIRAITTSNVASFEGQSVVIRGSVDATTPARLVLHVPVRFKNLLVLDGAVVDTLSTTISTERRVDLEITDNLYVDCDSVIDGNARGYLGGWAVGEDGGQNQDPRGRTLGNANDGGAGGRASASYAGLGGEGAGATNAPYGSLTSPFDLGSGGGGDMSNSAIRGGSGGGAIRITSAPAATPNFAIGGRVSADGAGGANGGGAGSGGSVYLQAATVRFGPGAVISANGGDAGSDERESRGGGGGRIALTATDLLDLGTPVTRLEARGGRNGSTGETTHVDGGAGSVYLRRPGQAKGEIIVSSFDTRYPQSAHKTRPLVLAGVLDFDAMSVGPRALVRADADLTINGLTNDRSALTVDPTGTIVFGSDAPSLAVTATPVDGSNLRIGSNLALTYTASALAGVRDVTLTWSLASGARVDHYYEYPLTTTSAPISFAVPAGTQPGAATLQVRTTDRAGRERELAPMTWNVVANELPSGIAALANGTPASLYAGKSFTVNVQATDAEGLTEVRPKVTGPAVATPSAVSVNGTSALATFVVTIDKTATAGTTIVVGASVVDSLGGSADTNDVSVGVLADTVAPSVTVSGLAASGTYYGGQTVQAAITVTDEVGASEVVVEFDGTSTILTGAGPVYTFTKTIDAALAEARTTSFRVTATDYASHTAQTDPVTIQLRPDTAPTIVLGSIVPNSTPPAGATIGATASLTDDVGVASVTFRLTGAVTFEQTRQVSNKTLADEAFTYALPTNLAGGDQIHLEAIATDTLGHVTPALPVDFTISADATKPVITSFTVSAPPSGTEYRSGDVVNITVEAVDDVQLQLIALNIAGGDPAVTSSSATSPLTLTWTVPELGSSTTFTIGVRADDASGNFATDSRTITAQPLNNAGVPTASFTCPSAGAYLPSGYSEFVLTASASDDAGVRLVEFFQADRSSGANAEPNWIAVGSVSTNGSPLSLSANSMAVTLPTVSVATEAEFRARAWDYSNNYRDAFVRIQVVPTVDLNPVGGNDWNALEGEIAVLRSGEWYVDSTLSQPRRLGGMIVLPGATIRHSSGASVLAALDIAGPLYVACGGSIDVSGKGYGGGETYPGETVAGNTSGGSHIGLGGPRNVLGSTYGSVYQPAEYGGGGDDSKPSAGYGGGAVRLNAGLVVVDGAIRANGVNAGSGGGAGGSIWITTDQISGSGTVEANGGSHNYGEGGGGAIAIEYSDATSVLPGLLAHTGLPVGEYRPGGAGSIYVKGPDATYGTLTIDNKGHVGQATVLPSLGSGTAGVGTGGATLVTDRGAGIPAFFVGHWVEILNTEGIYQNTYRIVSIDGTNQSTVTLESADGSTVIVNEGDRWQGVYRFDQVNLSGASVITSVDPIRLPAGVDFVLNGPTGNETFYWTEPLRSESVVINGNVAVPGIEANTLVVNSGAVLKPHGSGTLSVKAGTITVNGSIDGSGRGYGGGETYPGETIAGNRSGGSHIGLGGQGQGFGSTYGSVYQPVEYGGGGDDSKPSAGYGGGAVRLDADLVVVDGAIRANGVNAGSGGGAGGSIWITTDRISGSGTIEANGGSHNYGEGGGGAIAIEYSDATSVLPELLAHTGIPVGEYRPGGAGSIYVKDPDATYGTLTIDNKGHVGQATVLPSLGSGLAADGSSGAELVMARTTDIPPFFIGHWVEIYGPGVVEPRGVWRIRAIDNRGVETKIVILEADGTSAPAVSVGDVWQGVYRFDVVDLKGGAKLTSIDPVVAPNFNRPTGVLALSTGQAGSVFAGSTINVDLSASDLQGLSKVVLKASGPVVSGSVEQTKTTTATSFSTQFQVAVLTSATPGSSVTIWADVYDNIGTVTRTVALQLLVIEDTIAPVISSVAVSPTSADLRYPSGTALTFTATATDNVAVSSVSFDIGGAVQTDDTAPFQFTWTAPQVLSDTSFVLTATARDAQGNSTPSSPITIIVAPADGGAAPQVVWTHPSPYAQVPAGYPIRFGVNAVDDVGVVRIEFFEEGAAQPFFTSSAPNFATTTLSAETSLILPSTPGERVVRVRVYDISPVYSESEIRVDSVASLAIDPANPDWASLATTPGVLQSGTLTLTAPRHVAGLFVLDGASVKPAPYAGGTVTPLDLTIDGTLFVERGGSIDASSRGYDGTVNGYAKTWWPTSADTSYNGGGGSHGGRGGDFLANGGYAGRVYGSVYAPALAGSAGSGRYSSLNCTACSPGGGIVTLRAQRVIVDGTIAANGGNGGDAGGAAGGSVSIEADEIVGSGSVSAFGGQGHAGGGGGRIALDSPSIGLPSSNVTARTGRNTNESFRAAPGTVWMRGTGTYGSLLVSDEEVDPPQATELPSLGTGVALAGSGATNADGSVLLIVDRPIASFFDRHYVEVAPTGGGATETWRIKAIENLEAGQARLALEPVNAPTALIVTGDSWRGVYHFDSLTLVNGAGIGSGDPIYVNAQLFEETCVVATVGGDAAAGETVWFDDAIPTGASTSGTWNWVADQHVSGGLSHFEPHNAGYRQHYFDNATARLDVAAGDTLFTYVLIDPCDPPREIMLQFNNGNWEHRAYWGENLINFGANGSASRRSMGALPAAGQWIRLEVPVSQIGVEGTQLKGMAFTIYGGKVWFDRAGKFPATAP